MQKILKEYEKCALCGRSCGVNRSAGEIGFCGVTDRIKLARAALHYWEEPVISGERGSGTIFFTGCSLGCIYCQNSEISQCGIGEEVTVERFAEIMTELEAKGAHNVNLVTPTHYAPSIISAVSLARENGLSVPIVYNTSSYDSKKTVDSLSGTVDIYLADLKYHLSDTAKKYSKSENYPFVARGAIKQMVEQRGRCIVENRLMKSGVIVRILLLPGHLAEAKLCCSYLLSEYGDDIYISLMSQYTPMGNMPSPLNRRVTRHEYGELCDYAIKKGLKNGFVQEGKSASESFIPSFDFTGI